jgi:hypothetical protein
MMKLSTCRTGVKLALLLSLVAVGSAGVSEPSFAMEPAATEMLMSQAPKALNYTPVKSMQSCCANITGYGSVYYVIEDGVTTSTHYVQGQSCNPYQVCR